MGWVMARTALEVTDTCWQVDGRSHQRGGGAVGKRPGAAMWRGHKEEAVHPRGSRGRGPARWGIKTIVGLQNGGMLARGLGRVMPRRGLRRLKACGEPRPHHGRDGQPSRSG